MKKNHLLLFILLLGYLGLKAQETIDNPPYKFRNTALYRIEKVECTDQDTKVYLRTEFIPGWWVQFSKEEINLKDNLGNRYRPLALEGAAWEEQKPTPASGTDHFIFTFPPLSSGVTSIDFLEGKSGIFDIRLTGDIPSIRTPLPTTLTGNWLTTDGSNRWTYGFYPEFVIEGNRFWAYEKIETKGKKLILHLKSEGQHRQLLLSEQKDGYYKIGTSRKTQRLYKREDYRMEQVSGNQAEKSFFQPAVKPTSRGISGVTIPGPDLHRASSTTTISLPKRIFRQSSPYSKTDIFQPNCLWTTLLAVISASLRSTFLSTSNRAIP